MNFMTGIGTHTGFSVVIGFYFSVFILSLIFTDYLSSPDSAVGPVCVCLCVLTITFKISDPSSRYLVCWFSLTLCTLQVMFDHDHRMN